MQNAAVEQATTPAQSTGWPSVTHPALNNAPAVKNTVDLPTWEELTDIRDTLNTAIDKELSRTTSDALFLALRRVRCASVPVLNGWRGISVWRSPASGREMGVSPRFSRALKTVQKWKC
ncbi:tail/DNA circulation protein [Shigella flexneri]|nr:tail/DNA circulation protein [Shigella flexneri]